MRYLIVAEAYRDLGQAVEQRRGCGWPPPPRSPVRLRWRRCSPRPLPTGPRAWCASRPGRIRSTRPGRAARLPLCVVHGAQDTIAPVERSLEMVRAIRRHGGEVR